MHADVPKKKDPVLFARIPPKYKRWVEKQAGIQRREQNTIVVDLIQAAMTGKVYKKSAE